MLEPKPQKLSIPNQEPTLRVGLVLPEDKIRTITLNSNTALKIANQTEALPQALQIQAQEDKVLLRNSSYDNLEICPEDKFKLAAKIGINLSPIIAGRSFHWRKEINAYYPGTLNIEAQQGSLKIINTIGFEDYLACVSTSEMGSECPAELLKAQIVAARSWAYIYLKDKHPNSGFDICNDDDCQRYQGSTFLNSKAILAGLETRGEFLISEDSQGKKYVTPAHYIKTCGGITEIPSEIFDFEEDNLVSIIDSDNPESIQKIKSIEEYLAIEPNLAYCGRADSPQLSKYLGKVDQGGSHFRWTQITTPEELNENLNNFLNINDFKQISSINIIKRSKGFRVTELEIVYLDNEQQQKSVLLLNQYQIRQVLSKKFLPSSAFIVHINSAGNLSFIGAGWGHGVGLCQIGALVMALEGKSYREILKHYFPHSEIIKAY
jgi:stage II sporulation protein D